MTLKKLLAINDNLTYNLILSETSFLRIAQELFKKNYDNNLTHLPEKLDKNGDKYLSDVLLKTLNLLKKFQNRINFTVNYNILKILSDDTKYV